ncbi:MAG: hypothetical protein ACTJH9_09510 [Pseudoalteromonas sp.]|uniref:hypothetical protein n=1 Tax=unclassified Pseudoalteromonas TaxID=194690 RepID=UPI003F9BD9DE
MSNTFVVKSVCLVTEYTLQLKKHHSCTAITQIPAFLVIVPYRVSTLNAHHTELIIDLDNPVVETQLYKLGNKLDALAQLYLHLIKTLKTEIAVSNNSPRIELR